MVLALYKQQQRLLCGEIEIIGAKTYSCFGKRVYLMYYLFGMDTTDRRFWWVT